MEGVTYLRFGRGSEAVAVEVDSKTRQVIANALRNATIQGEMATGGGTAGRTPEGTDLANKIFKIVDLLEEKKD